MKQKPLGLKATIFKKKKALQTCVSKMSSVNSGVPGSSFSQLSKASDFLTFFTEAVG